MRRRRRRRKKKKKKKKKNKKNKKKKKKKDTYVDEEEEEEEEEKEDVSERTPFKCPYTCTGNGKRVAGRGVGGGYITFVFSIFLHSRLPTGVLCLFVCGFVCFISFFPQSVLYSTRSFFVWWQTRAKRRRLLMISLLILVCYQRARSPSDAKEP